MPRARHSRLALAAGTLAAAALGAVPAPAAAQPSLGLGAWQSFAWYDGTGPADDPVDGFLLTLAGPARLRVVDGGVVGDVFDVLLQDALGLTTSTPDAADVGLDTNALDGDAAWAAAALSRGELRLDAGTYRVRFDVRTTAPGYDFGEGFVRVDALEPAATVAPEPASVALLAGGLPPLAALVRVRRRATSAGREG